MKNFLISILALFLSLLGQDVMAKVFSAVNDRGQKLEYKILSESNHTVALTKGKYNESTYYIPAQIEYKGVVYTVTELGQDCFEDNKKIEYIYLPNTIEAIGESSFSRAENLREISIPSSVKKIGPRCFNNAKHLEKVVLPEGLEELEEFCFRGAENLREIIIPSSVRKLGPGCFGLAKNLQKIKLSEGLVEIGVSCFYQTENLKEIELPSSLRTIKGFCFYHSGIRKLHIPEGVTSIEQFIMPQNVSELYIPSTLNITPWKGLPENNYFKDSKYLCFARPIESGGYAKYATSEEHLFFGQILNLPNYITESNCRHYGLSKHSVRQYWEQKKDKEAQKRAELSAIESEQRQAELIAKAIQQSVVIPQNVNNVNEEKQERKKPSSDVDVNIPLLSNSSDNTFAVIISNENYQEEVGVDYAMNDGEIFMTYCKNVLGIPEENIHCRFDATLNNIKAELTWIQKVATAYNGTAKFIVYYSGHGVPDEATGTSYLLPVDGKGTMLETGLSLAEFYKVLGEMPSAGVTVFMDACFSGSKRGDGMLASARGIAIKSKPEAPKGNMVIFSAAQGDETAYPFRDKEHGLFTYYLLKKLQETEGNTTLGDLSSYLTEQVGRKSIVANGKSQTPTVSVAASMGESWKNLKLK